MHTVSLYNIQIRYAILLHTRMRWAPTSRVFAVEHEAKKFDSCLICLGSPATCVKSELAVTNYCVHCHFQLSIIANSKHVIQKSIITIPSRPREVSTLYGSIKSVLKSHFRSYCNFYLDIRVKSLA